MTLTRELRLGIAFSLAILTALTVFVWGNQRQADAAGLGSFITHCIVFPIVESQVDIDFNDEGECPSGSVPPGTLTVIKHVVNTGGGTAQAGDFTMHVAGTNPSSGAFAGSESGVTIALDPGAYAVTESGPSGYDATYSGQCSGVMVFSDRTCTITNTFHIDSGGGDDDAACADGDDNDNDGKVDFPADPGCTGANDTDEADEDTGGGGNNPQCSDGNDNDSDGQTDFPNDSDCTDANDGSESPDSDTGGSDNGGGGHHHSSRSSSNSGGEVLGASTECPMYLTGYIRYGAQNDVAEVSKLQVFLNDFEAHALSVTGVYDAPTLAAVNAFQAKYAADILEPWGMRGPSGYVYYTTQKEINTIYCKFGKGFPLSEAQVQEIAYVRSVQPDLRAQRGTAPQAGTAAAAPGKAASPAIGSVVLPSTAKDENAADNASQTAAAANASSTQGWFSKFVHWLFGR